MAKTVFAQVGDNHQVIGGTCPAGHIEMQGLRPSPNHIATLSGAWEYQETSNNETQGNSAITDSGAVSDV